MYIGPAPDSGGTEKVTRSLGPISPHGVVSQQETACGGIPYWRPYCRDTRAIAMSGTHYTVEQAGATPDAEDSDPFTDDDVTSILDDAWDDLSS